MYNNESNSRVKITTTKTRCNIVFVQNYWLLVGTVITPIMQNVKNQSFTIRLFPNPKSISYYVLICEHNTKLNRWVGHWSHLSNAPLKNGRGIEVFESWTKFFADIAGRRQLNAFNKFDGTVGGRTTW
jgi:hypothetical protein